MILVTTSSKVFSTSDIFQINKIVLIRHPSPGAINYKIMITEIIITGQIFSVLTLKNKITNTGWPEIKKSPNGYILTYSTKGEAIKALSVAYQALKADEPDYEGIFYRRGSGLDYDAAQAYIYNPQV